MLSKKIIDTDAFMDMPLSTQALYMHLVLNADDDGFVGSPKKVMRSIGCMADDIKILEGKRFILGFESGVIVIKHWAIHNLIRSDRYTMTTYTKEKAMLTQNSNKSYTLDKGLIENVIPSDNQMDPQVSIGKVSIGKYSIVKDIDKTPTKSKRFVKPTIEELEDYKKEKELIIDTEYFLDFYESKGWKVGKNPMKDWKAAVRNWARNNKTTKPNRQDIKDIKDDYITHIPDEEANNGPFKVGKN